MNKEIFKYKILVSKVRRDVCATRTLIVYASNNDEAINKAKKLDKDDWDNYLIEKIKEIRN